MQIPQALSKQKPKRYIGFRDRIRVRTFGPTRSDWSLVQLINERSDALDRKPDRQLQTELDALRSEVSERELALHGDSILLRSLAVAKQAIKRSTTLEAYDVQLLAGIAMARGAIAQMQTGEGKTLTSIFPIVAHAIGGRGIHVATVNSYLAERDFEFLSPALSMLGISASVSKDGDTTTNKQAAYLSDVTFATGYELGFDFLRDQIAAMSAGQERLGSRLKRELFQLNDNRPRCCQRSHTLAIIDEIDSVFIDEAITPLVISAGSVAQKAGQETYQKAAETAGSLIQDEDYVVDIIEKTIFLTKAGSEKIYRQFESPQQTNSSYRSLRDINQELDRVQKLSQDCQNEPTLLRPWHEYVESALRANHIMTKDVHYVVRDDRIEIVDEYTGRIFSDRNWRDGLHQAVEVKECVKVTDEKRTIGRISRQRYFQRYDLLCGMTGTIVGHEREMLTAYDLPIVVIPLKKKSQRTELATRYFSCQQSKNDAIELDVASRQKKGQPVLIGTRTIEQTIMLAKCLTKQGIHHDVFNGVQDKAESELISRAGRSGSVVIATNMAGRGTDIKLDERALAAGGLHVIGYERNRSKRIDLQLLGRAGRQGDPGSGQFFVSATDEIVTRYDRSFQMTLARLKGRLDGATNRNFDNRVRRIQQKAERESREQRDSVMREELWLDEVRKAVSNS